MLAFLFKPAKVHPIAAKRSDRVSGSAVTTESSLKQLFPADQLVPACHQLAALE
jgi:hypothetical protein